MLSWQLCLILMLRLLLVLHPLHTALPSRLLPVLARWMYMPSAVQMLKSGLDGVLSATSGRFSLLENDTRCHQVTHLGDTPTAEVQC